MKTFTDFIKEQQTLVNGGFNIARSQMPQMNDIQKFLRYLNSIGVFYAGEYSVPISSIKPTQIEFDQEKVDGMELSYKPIIISSDWFILDGHHRFYKHSDAQKSHMNVIQVDATINQLLSIAQDFLKT
jgi:hypothetical protein